MLLPQGDIDDSRFSRTVVSGSTPDSSSNGSEEESVPTPFRDTQLERAQEAAREELNFFSSMQDIFEKNQFGSEAHRSRYGDIIDRANNGDQLFSLKEYEAALDEFRTAVEEMQQLLADVDSDYEKWLDVGTNALDARNPELADRAFSNAVSIKPLEAAPQIGLDRVRNLPEINELLRESERSRLRSEWTVALSLLNKAENLDPLTPGIEERRTRILNARADEEITNLLSEGHQALNQKNYDEADRLFSEVNQRRPGNSAANTGLQQSARSRTADKISELERRATSEEEALNLIAALATYNEALAIDSNLHFALNGRERVSRIINLTNEMQRVLDDRGALSDDSEFADAKQVLTNAEKFRGHSANYDKSLDEMVSLIEFASQQLPVVLLSDNLTEVTLSTQGPLGMFERYELTLRPGRYQLIGSRDGAVDVRKTITVDRDMEPVSIICETQI